MQLNNDLKTINELSLNENKNDIEPDETALNCDYDEAIESILNDHDTTINKETRPRMIKYDVMINQNNKRIFPLISFEDVDKYDFNKHAFNEFIISEDYVHLYFDFDSMYTSEEAKRDKANKENGIDEIIVSDEEQLKRFDDVIQWLDSLKTVFGEYSIGGYTDSQAVYDKYHLRLYPEGKHFVSVHVVYYQTKISTKDLMSIMKFTEKKGFETHGVNQFCDPNVYKLVSRKANQTTRQVFRHVLSDKIWTTNDKDTKNYVKNIANHGFIINNTKPSQQIVQIKGDER